MEKLTQHTFHIPVMGLGFTIDTPIKVARFGISSVISIIEDGLIEQMRKYYCEQLGISYFEIKKGEDDYRAKRITAYLNLVHDIVLSQLAKLKKQAFESGSEIVKYFELLPNDAPSRKLYDEMVSTKSENRQHFLQEKLRKQIVPGSIDVNIMSKLDNLGDDKNGNPLPVEYSDALSALRGFGQSHLHGSVVFSAGYNPRLYGYIDQFPDFFPDENGHLKKKVILKVSDCRSALIQGKLLAKKGVWVSEFRIESGLNCGGHAFATEGQLMGPILEEFKEKKAVIASELFGICQQVLASKGWPIYQTQPTMKVTVQGGIGTANEQRFLLEHYQVDGTGWGSPFLLVPEATHVDEETLQKLVEAEQKDYYLSHASPLGVPFNNFKNSTSEAQRLARIEQGSPGSPCYKKFLTFNTEFTKKPICTASRTYQKLKIKQLNERDISPAQYEHELTQILEKECICEGLGAAALIKNGINPESKLQAVAICPGPNLAFFSGIFSLKQMVDHIYGRDTVLNKLRRPNIFINELALYVDYLEKEMRENLLNFSEKQQKYLQSFKSNLLTGIEYYQKLANKFTREKEEYIHDFINDLNYWTIVLENLEFSVIAK